MKYLNYVIFLVMERVLIHFTFIEKYKKEINKTNKMYLNKIIKFLI